MSIQVFAFGAKPKKIEEGSGNLLHVAETSLAAASHISLNDCLQRTTGELLVLCNGRDLSSQEVIESTGNLLLNSPELAGALLWTAETPDWISDAWKISPHHFASLLFPPESFSCVALRQPLAQEIGGFRDVAAPLWDLIIRLSQTGRELTSLNPRGSVMPGGKAGVPHHWLPALVPTPPSRSQQWLMEHLQAFPLITWGEIPNSRRVKERALMAGLFQWHDYLDESHQLSQSIEGAGRHRAGDYWHAIMHRREPDYPNSKYWFRRVGQHPVFTELPPVASAILNAVEGSEVEAWAARLGLPSAWDPAVFVDLCAECAADESSELALAARQIQLAEMLLLLRSNWDALS